MKKLFFFITLISLSTVVFSQTSANQPLKTNKDKPTNTVLVQKDSKLKYSSVLDLNMSGEKIQTTLNGVIVHQGENKINYPTPMYEQKILEPIKELKK